MPKPNAEEFAKHVLWYLCGVQAQLREVEAHLAFQASARSGVAVEKILDEASARRLLLQNELFDEAMKRSGLSPGQDEPPLDPRL